MYYQLIRKIALLFILASSALTYIKAQNEIIVLEISNSTSKKITLILNSNPEDKKDIKIDLGDGKQQLVFKYGFPITFNLCGKSNKIKIYGKITDLNCANNNITSIEISQNPNLERLYCHYNELTKLDISKNPTLKVLYCHNNNITDIDISNNTDLEIIDCSSNLISTLDSSRNLKLTSILCTNNKVTTLELSQFGSLQNLFCHNNNLTECNLKGQASLHNIWIFNNKLLDSSSKILFESLPKISQGNGTIQFINFPDKSDLNSCTKHDVETLKSKGWEVYDWNNSDPIEYTGNPISSAILVDENDQYIDYNIYNINGVSVGKLSDINNLVPGIYISNGKKYIIK